MHRALAPWGCILALGLLPCGARADGLMRDGAGAIAAGRGGTNLAFADNGGVLLDNPAGMVNFAGRGLIDCSADGLICDIDYSDPENNTQADLALYPLGHLAFLQKGWDDRLAYGLGVFTPAGFGAEYEMVNPRVDPNRVNFEYMSFGAVVRFLPAVAVQATERLSVGGTLGVAASHAELEAPYAIQTGPLAGASVHMDLQATGAALCWSAGVQYRLTDRTMLGAAYNSPNRFRLDGGAAVTVAGLPGASRYDLDAYLTWPQTVGVGVQHQFCDCRRLGVDVIWYNWSRAFDQLDLTLTGPSNPAYAFLGNQLTDSFPLRWRDSVSARVGWEQMLSETSVARLGYVYHRNPVPPGTLTPLLPGTLEHAVTLGYGNDWSDHSVHVAYMYSFGPDQEVGASDILGGDYDNSRVETSVHWIMLTLMKRW